MAWQAATYQEAIEKEEKRRAKRAAKPERGLSKAALDGATRSAKKQGQSGRKDASWKTKVKQKYDYRCQHPACGIRDRWYIHAHHIAPKSQRVDLKHVVSNGTCLCEAHHRWAHNNHAAAETLGLFSTRSRELAIKEGTLGVR